MTPKSVRFLSLMFVACCLGPSLAHLLELPNKMGLPRDEYLIVQQIYRGWAWLGIVVAGALLSTGGYVVMARGRRAVFVPALVAFLCVVGAQVVFWTFTFPANQETQNWTALPEHWAALRRQWEYSHAAGAVLNLVATMALIVALMNESET